MKRKCPICEKEGKTEIIKKRETLNIRGENIEVDMEIHRCESCGEEILRTDTRYDPFEQAYRIYRKKNCMLQPEEIKAIRKKYGLTQTEFSKILGWGLSTLSRYENGALQDEAHDKILRLIAEPRNLLKLISQSPNALDEDKKRQIVRGLEKEELESFSFENLYDDLFARIPADENSGFKKLDINKVLNGILFFCKNGEFKTKVNKLLFYVDFKHYRDYTTSIFGLRYAHGFYGPVPDKYEFYYAALIEKGSLNAREYSCDCAPDIIGENLISMKDPDLSIFSETELMELAFIRKYFKDFTSTKIKNYSHKERGYQDTLDGDIISYDYAKYLRL